MVDAVIFDFYGTLAHWADRHASSYEAVFEAFGYTLEPGVLDNYYARYDGVEHSGHSVSETAYEVWARSRLGDLAAGCGVAPAELDAVIDGLRAADQGPMVAYPEARATLSALRSAGVGVGVCSNWGWELDAHLAAAGLLELVDSTVTSARAGSRKPHPGIYAKSVEALGVDVSRAVFVGDSWEPDVQGPRRIGMASVHVWRPEERNGQIRPPSGPATIASPSCPAFSRSSACPPGPSSRRRHGVGRVVRRVPAALQ